MNTSIETAYRGKDDKENNSGTVTTPNPKPDQDEESK